MKKLILFSLLLAFAVADGPTARAGLTPTTQPALLDTAGDPAANVGKNGDFAFDDATKTIYGPKAAGVWPTGVVLGGSGGSAEWGDITGDPEDQTDLTTRVQALIAAAVAGKGVIGTAMFNPSGGNISSEFENGIISSVEYVTVGHYIAHFTPVQPDTNYIAYASAIYDPAVVNLPTETVATKRTDSIDIYVNQFGLDVIGGVFTMSPYDPAGVQVSIVRLSQ